MALDLNYISIDHITRICEVSKRTAERMKARGIATGLRERILRIDLYGDLGAANDDWDGFTLDSQGIITPNQDIIPQNELRLIWLRKQQLRDALIKTREPQQWRLL